MIFYLDVINRNGHLKLVLGGGQLWPAGLRSDLNGQLAGQPSVNWPAVCGPFLKRPTFPGPATRQTDRDMAGQILKDREVAGQLSAKIKTDREVAGQLTDRP
ncbi:hypothetical protein BpHYR1_028742 [Brachionus plicatilis]|uniref:Uncharacterized protein n=1 Tax=Brachionus plicatilis TaxID=10195 RepID=A0A3M7PV97_BRAPC|nr:hypothetical protein BpHYR1_028742 [Brachionus plicatilis]